MVNFPGRNGRRRRVLNEDVLSASSSHTVLRAFAQDDSTRETPRYSDAAGVEHHPQVTDFVPRRVRSIALLIFGGAMTATLLALLNYFSPRALAALGLSDAAAVDVNGPAGLAAWIETVVMFVTSVTCLLVYSIRRHRIDDIRGRYRIWLAAAAACLIVSIDCVVGLHQLLASAMGNVTGWTALRHGAVWWVILGGLPLTWIAVRVLLDTRESRLAVSMLSIAIVCYAVAAVCYLGLLSVRDPRIEALATGTAIFAGHWSVFVAVVCYARFVILDAQGLINVQPRIVRRRAKDKSSANRDENHDEPAPTSKPSLLAAGGYSRQSEALAAQAAKSRPTSSRWTDGSQPERDPYDDDGDDEPSGNDRKITKSERKRLRKLKSQHRAA